LGSRSNESNESNADSTERVGISLTYYTVHIGLQGFVVVGLKKMQQIVAFAFSIMQSRTDMIN
jgi:hypothetical protein